MGAQQADKKLTVTVFGGREAAAKMARIAADVEAFGARFRPMVEEFEALAARVLAGLETRRELVGRRNLGGVR